MKLFCESTLVHEENNGKESVIIQLLINDLYDQMNIIFPCLAYRKMALVFFSTNSLLCRGKTRRKFHVNGKRENAYFHVETARGQPANAKIAGK